MRHALIPLGEFAKITEWLQQAEVLARSIDDRVRLGRIASHVSNNFFNTGEPGQAVEAARQALTIASDLGDFGLGVAATFYLGRAQHSLGNYREAVELLTRNIQALHGELVYEACGLAVLPSVQSRSWRAWSLAELGDFTGAVASGTEAIAIAETRKRAHDSIHAYSGIAVPSLIRGDFDKAIPELEQVLSLIRLGDLPVYFPRFASQLGLALVRLGRRREALPLLQEAVERATAMGQMSAHSLRLGALGEAYFLEGQIDEARRLSRQALDVARQYQEGGNEASILRLLAEVTAELHPSDRALAESYYREALMRAEARGMRPLVAHCHLGLGRLYQMTGQPQQAREHLASAMTLYREMEMTYWLEKAQGWASAT